MNKSGYIHKKLEMKLRIRIDTDTLEICKPKLFQEWSWKELKEKNYVIHWDGRYVMKQPMVG